MPKNTGKKNKSGPVKNQHKPGKFEPEVTLADLNLDNEALQAIIKQSQELVKGANENSPMFLERLEVYADKKAAEIVDAAKITSEINAKPQAAQKEEAAVTVHMNISKAAPNTQKAKANVQQANEKAQSVAKNVAPPAPQKHHHNVPNRHNKARLVNPGGADTAYFEMKADSCSLDIDPGTVPPPQTPRFEMNNAYFQKPKVIAEQLLSGQFPFTFQFNIDVYLGLTGCVRHCSYFYSGNSTFETIFHSFRHRYCESEVIQWFYMNYAGELMEITDTLSLNHMLITHGAFPKGAHESVAEVGKVLCINRCSISDTRIYDIQMDRIVGMGGPKWEPFSAQRAQFAEYLPFQLAPDTRYAELFEKILEPTAGAVGEDHPYNGYYNITELVMFCQRKQDLNEMLNDPRSMTLGTDDLLMLMVTCFKAPAKNMSPSECLRNEYEAILKALKRSRHQTVQAYEHISAKLKDNVRKINAW